MECSREDQVEISQRRKVVSAWSSAETRNLCLEAMYMKVTRRDMRKDETMRKHTAEAQTERSPYI